jgi:hypothetical protein
MRITRGELIEAIREEINRKFGTDLTKDDISQDDSISSLEELTSWIRKNVSRASFEYDGTIWRVKFDLGPGIAANGEGQDLSGAVGEAITELGQYSGKNEGVKQ